MPSALVGWWLANEMVASGHLVADVLGMDYQ